MKQRLFAAAVLCGLLADSPGAHAFRKDTAPGWVHDAANEAKTTYLHNPDMVVLLDDDEYAVRADGSVVEHERVVKKILRPQARNDAYLYTNLDKDTKLNWMHIWSIGPDGHEYEVQDKELIEVAPQSEMVLYADEKVRGARPPATEPGAVIAMEYEKVLPSYTPQITWQLQDDEYPIHCNRLVLQLPSGYTYDAQWKRHERVAPTDLGNNRWQWEFRDVPGLDLKDVHFAPRPRALLSQMTLHYAPGPLAPADWKSIGVWYEGLSAGRTAPTPEITAKAQALTAGRTDFYEKAKAIEEFVQTDIRYVEIQIGIGGWQPHAAADVFRNHYGDCKDKATLLSAMLSAVGIRSNLMIVDSDGAIDPAMPSMFADHMISAIEMPEGYKSSGLYSLVTAKTGKRYLITDPTWEHRAPFGQIEDNLQGTYGLLIAGADSEAIRIPVLDPDRNSLTRSAHMKLNADGSLSGEIIERMYGDEAASMRNSLNTSDDHHRSEMLGHRLNDGAAVFTLNNVKTENLEEISKDLVLSYSVTDGVYAKPVGSLLMVPSRVLGTDASSFDDKPRQYPVVFGKTMLVHDDFEVQLPAGYVVDELPEPVKMDVGFAGYESKTTVDKNAIHYVRTYTVREVEVPAKKYSDFRELMGTIATDERSNVILRKTP